MTFTRGCIARLGARSPPRFSGVYHHWDNHPSGLGRALYRLRNGRFRKNTEAMLRALIDEHPAGWSTIVDRSFDRTPSFSIKERGDLPQCYCHGRRSEKGWTLTQQNAAGSGVEFVYGFDGNKMIILGSYLADGTKMPGTFGAGDDNAAWALIAAIGLNSPEPDWGALDRMAATALPRAHTPHSR